MVNYKEILRLSSLGIKNTQIASSCNCSRTTVINALKRAEECNFNWEKASNLSNEELTKRILAGNKSSVTYQMPDYEYVHHELSKKGVTLGLLWLEYRDQCRESGLIPYKHTQFYKYYRDFVHKTKATMHLVHKPGEIMEVDWAGQKVSIIDTDTGETVKVSIFVSVLSYSGYAYVEGFLSQNQENWTKAHVNSYRYFGGVTKILVPDNLKTGVIKNSNHETIINRSYLELAEYYEKAIIPARPYSPKDKATVEKSVNIVSTWILATLRNQDFLSLRELNEAIHEKLADFNKMEFQKREGSRASFFEEEKEYLLPLPEKPYEAAIWKTATVQYNYHVTVENKNYSCPYEFIRHKVDVRLTGNMVEIFYKGKRIASHPRLYGSKSRYSTIEEHMPPNHQKYVKWDGDRFRKWARSIGPETYNVVNSFLTSCRVEEQGYKSCMALLNLEDKYSPKGLEEACKRALTITERPSLKSIQVILRSKKNKLLIDYSEEDDDISSQYAFIRGPDYYREGDE